jgi:D-lactate dehydrogenase
MRVAVHSTKPYERPFLEEANRAARHGLTFLDVRLRYVPLAELYAASDIITLHCPLAPQTRRLIGAAALSTMKRSAMLINTGPGAVADASALIAALKRGHLGAVGLDVCEEEADLFFRDLSEQVIHDDVFVRLLSFPNVFTTAHQGFFTHEAVAAIAGTTIENLTGFERGPVGGENRVTSRPFVTAPGGT